MSEQHDRKAYARLEQELSRLRLKLNIVSSPLAVLLKRRGFRIFLQEPAGDLLIPSKRHRNVFYDMMGRYSFRLFLRDVIKHQGFFTPGMVARYATADVTAQYISYLLSLRLITRKDSGYTVAGKHVRSFGETLEWYVAEIFRREFSAEAVWGVRFKGRGTGGDYDVIAKLDCVLCYTEVKSSPPKQIYDSEIAAFLERVDDLAPEIAIFLMDTELRMNDKIVPMFEAERAKRGKGDIPVERMEKELFRIGRRIYIINAKGSVAGNLQSALSAYFRGSEGM